MRRCWCLFRKERPCTAGELEGVAGELTGKGGAPEDTAGEAVSAGLWEYDEYM